MFNSAQNQSRMGNNCRWCYEKMGNANLYWYTRWQTIIMQAVDNAGSTYYNYKGEHSIVLIAFVDTHRQFIYVDIGCNGRVSDEDGWDVKSLSQYLKYSNNSLNILPAKELPGRSIKYHILSYQMLLFL